MQTWLEIYWEIRRAGCILEDMPVRRNGEETRGDVSEHRSDPYEEERNHREGGKEEREKGQVILIYLYHVCSNATSPFR